MVQDICIALVPVFQTWAPSIHGEMLPLQWTWFSVYICSQQGDVMHTCAHARAYTHTQKEQNNKTILVNDANLPTGL